MLRRHRVSWYSCSSAFVLVASAAAFADDIVVPRDYRTVDQAIAAAAPGDRIVVRGGAIENLQVKKGAISIVAKGTTVQGYLWIDGSNVSVSGLRLGRNGRIVVTGGNVTVTGTRARGRGNAVISVQGGGSARIEGNKLAWGDIEAFATRDTVVTGNRLKNGAIRTKGAGVEVVSNTVPTIEASGEQTSVLDNDCDVLTVSADMSDVANNRVESQATLSGNANLVAANEFSGPLQATGDTVTIRDNSFVVGGVTVTGDDASLVSNTIQSQNCSIMLRGQDYTIATNDITSQHNTGIEVYSGSAGGSITDNDITHARLGMDLQSDAVLISGNELHGIESGTSISIRGTLNTVTDNTIVQTGTDQGSGDGIDIRGDANTVTGNDIGTVSQDAILVATGTGNVLTDNVIDATPGCGVVIACEVRDTVIEGCTVSACGMGVVNAGISTSMTGSTSQDNAFADILDLSDGFSTFEDNTYTTFSNDRQLAPPSINVQVFD